MALIEFKPHYVYMHIFPNGKKYIGYSHQNPSRRFRKGKGYKDLLCYDDILKYGWDNIKHIIIKDNLARKEAQELEKEMILKYKTNNEKYGYNKSIGTKLCKERIEEVRQRAYGNKNMLGKHHTEEVKKKLRQANLGKKMSETAKAKKSKPVIQYDKQMNVIKEYYGIHKASEMTGIYWTNIARCCNSKCKTAGGYIWKFKEEI